VIRSISITANQKSARQEYVVKVSTDNLDSMFRKVLQTLWMETSVFNKRRIDISDNEIRIYLKKGDTIQKYIDHIKEVYNKAEEYVRSGIDNRKPKKKMVLNKGLKNKTYLLKVLKLNKNHQIGHIA